MSRLVLLVFVLGSVFGVRPAWAHAAPHSVVLLDLEASAVAVELHLPVPELEVALGSAPVQASDVQALVARDLHLRSPDGAAWQVRVGEAKTEVDEQGPVVVVWARAIPPAEHGPRTFTFENDVIGSRVMNHTAWVGVRSDFAGGLVSGPPVFIGTTGYLHHALVVAREGSTRGGLRAALRLGWNHIAEGTDHLLFLLALLLPAPLLLASGRKRWGYPAPLRRSLIGGLRVVTAFTAGHSLTLLAGTLGWLRLPSAPVEVLVAISILVSAVHAVRPIFPGREPYVAAGFGFVHGLAFASALTDLHLGGSQLVVAVLGFNLGIEAMQLVVVATTFPWLLLLAHTRAYPLLRVGGATFAGVAAAGWIVQRTVGVTTPLDRVVTAVSPHPLLLLGLLALTAVIASRRWPRLDVP